MNIIIYNLKKAVLTSSVNLPFEIIENKVISSKSIDNILTKKYLLDTFIFYFFISLTNNLKDVYNIKNKKNIIILNSILITPLKCIYKISTYKSLISITTPNYYNYSSIILLRSITFYITLYYLNNFIDNKLIILLLSNTICFPLKLLSLNKGYNIIFDYKKIKNSIIIEILKSTFCDNILINL